MRQNMHLSPTYMLLHSGAGKDRAEATQLSHDALTDLQADLHRDDKRTREEPYDLAENVQRDAESVRAQLDDDSGLF